MPGDARLSGVVRGLAMHAANYVQLAPDAAEKWVEQVEQATEAAIAAGNPKGGAIDVRFDGRDAHLTVTISFAGPDGSRQTSEIRHRIPA